MCYVVCRNCKRYTKVDGSAPLSFDKCENCGHLQEFAENDKELQYILKGIEKPKVTYNKRCKACNSINPRETGTCLFCGSTEFYYQYDMNSLNQYQKTMSGLTNPYIPQQNSNNTKKVHINLGFRVFSLFIGLTDFIFFLLIGIQLVLGDINITVNPLSIVSQHFQPLLAILIISLFLSGLLSIFAMPRMSYKDSFKIGGTLGIIIGIVTGILSKNVQVFILGVILFGILTGIGGLVGEYIVQAITKKIGPGQI